MNNRQAITQGTILLSLLFGLSACSSSESPLPTPTATLPPPTATLEPTVSPVVEPPTRTPTPTPPACRTQPGRVKEGLIETTKPPQAYLIYLPPCYDEDLKRRYPVLYLLHGQTYTADQWIRLGTANIIDSLLLNGEIQPFLIVFPDDRYWNLPAGAAFGQRLVDDLIPYIDSTYRTLSDRTHRAIGGLSRGGGWALRLGFTRWDLFSIIGLHSPAVFWGDASQIPQWIAAIPADERPIVFMDIGNNDAEWRMAVTLETQFNENKLVHEWRLYNGTHTEEYWAAHVEEYLRWYAEQWNTPPP